MEFNVRAVIICCVDQPAEHSLKRYIRRVTESVLLALFIVLGTDFFPDSSRHHHHLLPDVLIALIFGLVFGTLRYLADREAARNEREPNVL